MLACEELIEVWRVPRVSMLDLFTDRKCWSSRRKHTLSLRMRARLERGVKLASSLCDLQLKTCSWLYHFAITYAGVVYCCWSSLCLCGLVATMTNSTIGCVCWRGANDGRSYSFSEFCLDSAAVTFGSAIVIAKWSICASIWYFAGQLWGTIIHGIRWTSDSEFITAAIPALVWRSIGCGTVMCVAKFSNDGDYTVWLLYRMRLTTNLYGRHTWLRDDDVQGMRLIQRFPSHSQGSCCSWLL